MRGVEIRLHAFLFYLRLRHVILQPPHYLQDLMHGHSSPAARAVPRLVVAILHCFLNHYRDLIDPFKLAMGPMFYFRPHGGRQMFRPVDLGRLRARPQLSARDSFPLVTCGFLQRRTKGRPSGRLHSDTQVSQQETPKTMHIRIGAPRMAL